MSIHHGWGKQTPQTASHIHIRHIQSDWAHWCAVHWHTAASLHSYTDPIWLRFWGSFLYLFESKCCHYGMVEADRHLKLLPPSTLDIYQLFEHIDRLSIGWYTSASLHSYTDPIWLRFWDSFVYLLELKWCHYVLVEANTDRHLMLPPSTLDIYQVFEHIDMLSIGIQQHPYIVIPTLLGSDFGVLGHLWSQNDVIMAWLRLTVTSNLSLILIFRHIQSIWAYYMLFIGIQQQPYTTQLYRPYLAQILGFFCVTKKTCECIILQFFRCLIW